MKKLLTTLLGLLLLPSAAFAQFTTNQGGTGTSSPFGILYGDSSIRLKTVIIGSNLTFTGGTLSSTDTTASSTLLSDNNTFSGFNIFTKLLTLASASSTNLSASNSLYGPFASGLVFFDSNKKATSITGTNGQVLAWANGLPLYVASTTLTNTSPITTTFNASTNQWTIACATCNTSSASVTSITGGTGLNGGTITSSGTLALHSYVSTSTADTANQISVFTSTNATPATFGGFANFTFNSATNLFTVINASTTNITASQSAFIASKQVNPYQNATFSYGATSTAWSGTTTETTLVAPFAGTLQDVQCVTSAGTLNVQAKVNSSNVVPMFNASTTKGTVTFTSTNTFVRGDTLEFDFGTPASSPVSISCTPRTTVTSF